MLENTIHRPVTRASHDTIPEEVVEVAELAPGYALRAVEVGLAVFVGLLVCPPLAILAVVVGVPLLAMAIVVAIVATPYLLVRRVREHHRTHGSSAVAHGLRRLRVREA